LTISDTAFVENAVDLPQPNDGSAIYSTGKLSISNCNFSNNLLSHPLWSGAIFNSNVLTVYNTSFDGNAGSGIHTVGGPVSIDHCSFSENGTWGIDNVSSTQS
jgi:hypothetical protein